MILRFSVLALMVLSLFITRPSMAEESPLEVPGAITISVEEAKKLFDDGVMFIDLRTPEDYNDMHIEGAELLDLPGAFGEDTLDMLVSKDEPVVFYCYGVKCIRSSTASAQALKWGYSQVYYFREGMPAWANAGYPVVYE